MWRRVLRNSFLGRLQPLYVSDKAQDDSMDLRLAE
jgi:hypothetical protein